MSRPETLDAKKKTPLARAAAREPRDQRDSNDGNSAYDGTDKFIHGWILSAQSDMAATLLWNVVSVRNTDGLTYSQSVSDIYIGILSTAPVFLIAAAVFFEAESKQWVNSTGSIRIWSVYLAYQISSIALGGAIVGAAILILDEKGNSPVLAVLFVIGGIGAGLLILVYSGLVFYRSMNALGNKFTKEQIRKRNRIAISLLIALFILFAITGWAISR